MFYWSIKGAHSELISQAMVTFAELVKIFTLTSHLIEGIGRRLDMSWPVKLIRILCMREIVRELKVFCGQYKDFI